MMLTENLAEILSTGKRQLAGLADPVMLVAFEDMARDVDRRVIQALRVDARTVEFPEHPARGGVVVTTGDQADALDAEHQAAQAAYWEDIAKSKTDAAAAWSAALAAADPGPSPSFPFDTLNATRADRAWQALERRLLALQAL